MTQSRAAMLIMLVAVLCFFVGDWFTVQAAKSLTVNQTLFIRLLIGLIAVYGFLFYRRKKVVYQNVFSSVVLLRSIAYTFAIYCFAASFAISEEMTSVYVISFLWPFIMFCMLVAFSYIPDTVLSSIGAKRRPDDEAERGSKTASILINCMMFIGILIYYWPRIASQPLFFLTWDGLRSLGTAVGYASLIAIGTLIPSAVGAFDELISALIVSFVVFSVLSALEVTHGIPVLNAAAIPGQLTSIALALNVRELIFPLGSAFIAGILSTLGFIFLTEAMTRGEAERVAPLDYCAIIISAVWTIGYERLWPSIPQWVGICVILLGAAMLIIMPKDGWDLRLFRRHHK